MTQSVCLPESYGCVGWLMSNFDHTIEASLVPRLQAEPLYGQYAGWNFFGKVWWLSEESGWACEVWQLHTPVAVLTAPTLEELMTAVSARFGDD